jgi:hypothetical protein
VGEADGFGAAVYPVEWSFKSQELCFFRSLCVSTRVLCHCTCMRIFNPYVHNKPVFREHSNPVSMCVYVYVCVCKCACLCVYMCVCVYVRYVCRRKECVAAEYEYIAVDATAAWTSEAFAHARAKVRSVHLASQVMQGLQPRPASGYRCCSAHLCEIQNPDKQHDLPLQPRHAMPSPPHHSPPTPAKPPLPRKRCDGFMRATREHLRVHGMFAEVKHASEWATVTFGELLARALAQLPSGRFSVAAFLRACVPKLRRKGSTFALP